MLIPPHWLNVYYNFVYPKEYEYFCNSLRVNDDAVSSDVFTWIMKK